MAVIKSGASTDNMTVDVTSKAARVTKYDTRGNVRAQKASYVAAITGTAAAAGTAPFFSLFGSATKTVRIQRIRVCGTVGTAAVYALLVCTKRTAVGTGGTATTITPVAKDSTSGAATATNVKFFTAAPTAGTGGGVVASAMSFLPITGTPALGPQPVVWTFGDTDEQEALVLRGANEGIELSTTATTTNAPTFSVMVEFTEE